MRIACPHCKAAYDVDERRVPAAGLNVRCPKCQAAFPVRPPPPVEVAPAAVPLPPAPGEDLGGSTIRFGAPFGQPPPAPGASGPDTGSFSMPFPEAPAAGPAAPPGGELGGATMRFEAPPPVESPAVTPPWGSVELPVPEGDGTPPAELPPGDPLGFGEVDLGPPPARAEPPAEERGAAPAGHLPTPVAPPAASGPGALGAAEARELEALFDEGAARKGAAPATGGGAQWRIRRRSGRVFGPFAESEVVQMLSRGELLGNEEVSGDGGTTWLAIGEVPALGEAIRSLIERPAGAPPARPRTPVVVSTQATAAAPESRRPGRAAELFGRMPRWTRIAAPAAVVVVVLGAGLAGGLTDYGIFFHRLVRGQVGAGRPGAKLCAQARAAFAEDGWEGAQRALALTRQAVGLSPVDREAKALHAQVAFWMARRTGVPAAEVAAARAALPELAQRAPQAPDTYKALVAASLLPGESKRPEVVAGLERWHAKTPGDEDAGYLLGEAALEAGDLGRAEALFQRIEQVRPSARSAHALGLVAAARGELPSAGKRFEEALKRDPRHLSSGIELAGALYRAGEAPAAATRLAEILKPEALAALGPRERARARQLRGEALARAPGADVERGLAEAEKELEAAVQDDPENPGARVALGRFLLRRNAAARALEAVQPAVASGGVEVVDLHARALAAAGRLLDATNAVEAARAKYPGNPRLAYARGLVLEASGKRAEAAQAYAEAAKDAAYWEPHLAIGRARLRDGDLAGASAELVLAAEKAPGEPDAQSGLGELRLAKGDPTGAEQAWRKALELEPGHAPSHLGMARVALARGNDAAAAASLERCVKLDARLIEARLELAALKWRRGDLAAAEVELQAASAADPSSAAIRTRLGAARLEQGKVDAALEDLQAASNADVASAENRYWLGRALLGKGEAAQAAEQLNRAVELDPKSARNRLWQGVAMERSARPAEALEAYREALGRDSKMTEAAERLALLLTSLGRPAEAVPWLEKAIQLAPREQRLRLELGDCRARMGQHGQAVQVYKDALRSDPKLVAAYYKIARSLHESQGAKPAIPWYEKAAQLEPKNPMPHYYLGFTHKERGRKAQAVASFRTYLQLKPDAEDRKDIEREIEDLGG